MRRFTSVHDVAIRAMQILAISNLFACGASKQNSPLVGSTLPQPTFKLQDTLNLPVTNATAMPVGTAAYLGTALYSQSTENPSEIVMSPDLQSNVNLQANFGTMVVVGRFDGFRTMSGSSISGSLTTNASTTGSRVSGLVNGSITQSGLSQTFSGQIDGSFRGNSGEFVAGEVQITTGQTDLYGLFGAQVAR